VSAPRIRTFADEDEAGVIDLWCRAGLTRPWNDPGKDVARKRAVQRELFLVATEDDIVVGTVMAGYEGHRGWVNYLAVDPSQRRRGIGRTLMAAAEAGLVARGCPKLSVQVRADNPEAVAFYERLGFAPDAVISLGKRLERDD
jgi:ribosomal protein S18 acetylase RimI-like enzyme